MGTKKRDAVRGIASPPKSSWEEGVGEQMRCKPLNLHNKIFANSNKYKEFSTKKVHISMCVSLFEGEMHNIQENERGSTHYLNATKLSPANFSVCISDRKKSKFVDE